MTDPAKLTPSLQRYLELYDMPDSGDVVKRFAQTHELRALRASLSEEEVGRLRQMGATRVRDNVRAYADEIQKEHPRDAAYLRDWASAINVADGSLPGMGAELEGSSPPVGVPPDGFFQRHALRLQELGAPPMGFLMGMSGDGQGMPHDARPRSPLEYRPGERSGPLRDAAIRVDRDPTMAQRPSIAEKLRNFFGLSKRNRL